MTSDTAKHAEIQAFEDHYAYNGEFMHDLLTLLPEGYTTFENFRPMAFFRKTLPLDAYWIAKLATMQQEDCGACLQLNVKMALEQGLPKELVHDALTGGATLPDELSIVYTYAQQVATGGEVEDSVMAQMTQQFNLAQLLELSLIHI